MYLCKQLVVKKAKMVDVTKSVKNAEPLKKWDKLVKRNANGQFERGSKALAGTGRPLGSQNRVTVALKEAILAAGEAAGGEGGLTAYLTRLAVENSSAYAGLLGKILPSVLAASDSHGGKVQITFRRIIVHPGGREEIQGATPKALPAPEPDETKAIEQ